MKDNFDKALAITLVYEGGFVNNPQDPGGATNKGITQRVYTAYLTKVGAAQKPVQGITDLEVRAIYKSNYWDQASCDDLPIGVDFAVFDYAVNSGVNRAVTDMQRGVGCTADGVAGVATAAAVAGYDPRAVVNDLCARRLRFLRTLRTWSTFGKGWQQRVLDVQTQALAMVVQTPVQPPAVPQEVSQAASAKAPEAAQSALKTQEGAGLSTAAIGGAGQTLYQTAQSVQPHISETPVGRAAFALFAFLLIAGGLLVGLSYLRKLKEAGGLGGLIGSIK